MVYTIDTTAEQEIVLGIAAKSGNQTNDQLVSGLITTALAELEFEQRKGFLSTIEQNDGIETLQQLASAPPNPDAQTK